MFLALESFDAESRDAPVIRPLSPDYQKGFSAGQTSALAAAAESQSQATAEIVQTLSDIAFTHADAQQIVLATLAPLMQKTLNTILPACLNASLLLHLQDLVVAAMKKDSAAPLTLRMHPKKIDAMRTIIAEGPQPHLTLIPDASLTLHAALFSTPTDETSFDLDAAMEQITAIFDPLVARSRKAE